MQRSLKNFMRDRATTPGQQQLSGEWRPIMFYPDAASPERLVVGVMFQSAGTIYHKLIAQEAWQLYEAVFSPDAIESFRGLLKGVAAALTEGRPNSPYSSIEYGPPQFAQYPSAQIALDSLFTHTVILMRPAEERMLLQGGTQPNPEIDTKGDLLDCLRQRRANIETLLLTAPAFADSLLAVDSPDKIAAVVAGAEGWHQLERQAMASALDLASQEKRRGLILWVTETLSKAALLPALLGRLAALNIETTITCNVEETAAELLKWL